MAKKPYTPPKYTDFNEFLARNRAMTQHNAHCTARIDAIFAVIAEALGLNYDLTDWYSCGDDLI